jgi:putative DNA primase/helicase
MTEASPPPVEYALAEAPEQTPMNPGASRPPIDFEQACKFLAALAPGETNFTFQTFDDSEAKRPEMARVMHGPLTVNFAGLSRLSAHGAGVFVTVNRTDLRGRREANIVGVRALFADLDGPPLSVLKRLGLPPHIVVISSPERFHAYWRVERVGTTEFAGLQERLAALFGGDPSVCDLPRVMRLPGFPHQKNPANPQKVWFQVKEHSGPYEADAFRAAIVAAERTTGEGAPVPGQGRANGHDGASFDALATNAALSFDNEWPRLICALSSLRKEADSREKWLRYGAAIYDASRGSETGFQIWTRWSMVSSKFGGEDDQRRHWASFGRGYSGARCTLGTIYFDADSRDPSWRQRASLDVADGVNSSRVAGTEGLQEPHATFVLLAALSPIEYDRARLAEAEKLGVRVGTLDEEVSRLRPQNDDACAAGRALSLASPEPWSDPVDGAALLEAIVETITRYVALSPAAAIAGALWCVHAHAFEAFYITPRLAIVSPEKRCGKSTLLRVLQPMLPKALSAANITVAAVFRTVEAGRPTLLIDEADSFLKDNEELRGIFNSGHACDGQVIRLVGDDHKPRVFSTWCPVAIAAIGSLPGTIEDRSIIIQMRRRRSDEKVERFRIDRVGTLQELGRKAARWVADSISALRDADPIVPTELNDRAADNWRPLLAIADAAGGVWPGRARSAAMTVCQEDAGQGESIRIIMLCDIRDIFRQVDKDRMSSQELVASLNQPLDRPWPTVKKGREIDPARLAWMLKPFGVLPGTIRLANGKTPKGYLRTGFSDAFGRYLPPESATPPLH